MKKKKQSLSLNKTKITELNESMGQKIIGGATYWNCTSKFPTFCPTKNCTTIWQDQNCTLD
ncbi:class I lanthipeptide [uncultured Kordia sp.]|uniref:class I lanthipeptide n=1 Tax=uncultured Kordia sp. TaxID=507699 RepID=UPI00260F0101|nr:class I lanthipeptide [uncultured Kordia sp.]